MRLWLLPLQAGQAQTQKQGVLQQKFLIHAQVNAAVICAVSKPKRKLLVYIQFKPCRYKAAKPNAVIAFIN